MAARNDFDKHVQRDEPLPLYAVLSADGYLRQKAAKALSQRVVEAAPDFNRDDLSASEGQTHQAIAAAKTLPMMAKRRFVHLRDAHKIKEKDLDALLRYVEAPSPTTVFLLSGERIDLRTKLAQRLDKLKALFVLEPPKLAALPAWIANQCAARNASIDQAAASLLADLVGVELGVLDTTLEQLLIYAHPRTRITSNDVEALVVPTRQNSIFDFTDALGNRDWVRASLLLRNALDNGESGLMLLSMIARQLRHILQTKTLVLSKTPNNEIASAVGVPPFLVSGLLRQAQHYSETELWRALATLAPTELRLKQSGLDHGVVLEGLVVQLMGQMREPARC